MFPVVVTWAGARPGVNAANRATRVEYAAHGHLPVSLVEQRQGMSQSLLKCDSGGRSVEVTVQNTPIQGARTFSPCSRNWPCHAQFVWRADDQLEPALMVGLLAAQIHI